MRLSFEACKDQQHFLPFILVTHNSTEWMRSNNFIRKIEHKEEKN